MDSHYIIGHTNSGKLEVVSVHERTVKTAGGIIFRKMGQFEVYISFGPQPDVRDVRRTLQGPTNRVKKLQRRDNV
jgi:hypothetical protein